MQKVVKSKARIQSMTLAEFYAGQKTPEYFEQIKGKVRSEGFFVSLNEPFDVQALDSKGRIIGIMSFGRNHFRGAVFCHTELRKKPKGNRKKFLFGCGK